MQSIGIKCAVEYIQSNPDIKWELLSFHITNIKTQADFFAILGRWENIYNLIQFKKGIRAWAKLLSYSYSEDQYHLSVYLFANAKGSWESRYYITNKQWRKHWALTHEVLVVKKQKKMNNSLALEIFIQQALTLSTTKLNRIVRSVDISKTIREFKTSLPIKLSGELFG